ncbi:major facilitator superfamily domain-containing protein [Pseudomassariella vexata]|uniref:Major facilitator superfamily domain-containing protein n=1 Tax=Pseudomassariella vexata TaxID=1141098 RepID=A0A1Y2E0A3_9PEZI|nr:major facilitator superfamily domain-containing protein [Pseudomassariella vexata]ORY64970.1 major facilitator superfamily domain-containing protein [Pseudomassariella vexata]
MKLLSWKLGRGESVHDYVGVLVPLEEAHLYSHSARSGRCEFEEVRDGGIREEENPLDDEREAEAGKDGENEDTGMLQMCAAEYTVEGLRREIRTGEIWGKGWTEYEMKSRLINKAIQDIGMGRYNWQLFVLCGFGWFADNLWMQGLSLILPSLSQEFDISEKTVRYTTSSVYVGLCIGSFFWGIGADILGRRIAFNMTLLITSIFGIAAAYAGSWGSVCFLLACMGTGVGGNLPVDGALFLEFLPDASSALLTLLSVWWPVGQLASSLAAWYFITTRPVEVGWRSFITAIGLATFIMFLVRFFVFHLFESPKYLLSQGRQAEAVAVVHGIAHRNHAKTWLTEEILDAVVDGEIVQHSMTRLSTANIIKRNLSSFSVAHLKPLFSTRKLGQATMLMWFCWTTIGMGYPLFNAFLPQYLSHGGSVVEATDGIATRAAEAATAETYRNYAIISMVGVPGSLVAAYTVDHKSPWLGRKGTLAISALVSAVFLFFFVTFGNTPNSQLFFTCIEAFTQNIMYGVLYAFTPEIFPAPVRGAGTGVASFLNRFAGLIAPVLAANIPGDGTKLPIYLSAVLIFAAFVGMCLMPIETRGRQSL